MSAREIWFFISEFYPHVGQETPEPPEVVPPMNSFSP
jgi:hypothetical protein